MYMERQGEMKDGIQGKILHFMSESFALKVPVLFRLLQTCQ
jgi:hypothetical protein